MREIEATVAETPQTDFYAKYSELLDEYNKEAAELEARQRELPKEDLVSTAEVDRVILDHFEEE